MTRRLTVQKVGPAVSLQDDGRPGGMGVGLSRSGAADRSGLLKACALLDQPIGTVAIEMAGFGGTFEFSDLTRFALTGAVMRATLNGEPLEWNAAHLAGPGAVLSIGATETGVYGYLMVAGGIETEAELGGRGYHRIAGLGQATSAADVLPLGDDTELGAPLLRLPAEARLATPIRFMPGPQTDLFSDDALQSFVTTQFRRSPKANRQGVRLDHDGAPFSVGAQLNQVSDFISEGDIQMTGDGTPYVLLADCQTMGGYPRIGTVLPCDLPRVAQAMPGDVLSFELVSLETAEALWQPEDSLVSTFRARCTPRVRDPREMADLLAYELIGKPIEL